MTWFGEEFFVDFLSRTGPPKDDEFRQLAMQAMQAFNDKGNAKTLTLRFHEWDPKYDLVATREVTLGEADEIQMPDD